MSVHVSRRRFLTLLPATVLGVLQAARRPPDSDATGSVHPAPAPWEHPEPRPGIDGSRVLTAEQLGPHPDLHRLFDGVRQIPHIVDGIRCHCGCADLDGYRSLLSCYEPPGMAQWCDVCQGAAELAIRGGRAGHTLDRIRRAIDARFAH